MIRSNRALRAFNGSSGCIERFGARLDRLLRKLTGFQEIEWNGGLSAFAGSGRSSRTGIGSDLPQPAFAAVPRGARIVQFQDVSSFAKAVAVP